MNHNINITQIEENRSPEEIENFFKNIVFKKQSNYESTITLKKRKSNGVFLTSDFSVLDKVLNVIKINDNITKSRVLEPSCGNGIFILRLLAKLYCYFPDAKFISDYINNNIVFIDIDPNMLAQTKSNIKEFYRFLFNYDYSGVLNGYEFDFTHRLISNDSDLFQSNNIKTPLLKYLNNIDYVIGNPPYVTLYGRRDKKQNESQRVQYLKSYDQFPSYLKNGKLNYVMLFIEHAFDFMKNNAKLCFIIDASFFETAYKYTRKYILDNSNVISLTHNISGFEGVASGQIILELIKSKYSKSNKVKILNIINNNVFSINQNEWYKPDDEYKFRINFNKQSQNIIYKVIDKSKDSLKLLFPKKNLRTCTMLLDMEKDFTSDYKPNEKGIKSFRYYQGSKALKNKYGILNFDKYFFYDKSLQDKINDQLKIELSKLGIKNKKRIGLGEIDIYENPKIYIRQSAKEIIASYDEQQSAANNSLYVFSLRSNSMESKEYLKFLCGYLNSDLVTFIAQQNNIIRYFRGKQPQIKISDLYTLNIPIDKKLIITISNMVTNIYKNSNIGLNKEKIDSEIYNYFKIDRNEKLFIEDSIKYFLIS